MRHRKKNTKFSRSRAQRKALIKSLLRSIIINERITTTRVKAKGIKKNVEKLITCAKEDSLANRRQVYDILGDHKLVKKLFDNIAPRFKTVPGGYTRVFNIGDRKGDGASMAILELTKTFKKETKKPKRKGEKTDIHPQETPKKKPSKEKEEKKGIFSGVKKILKKGERPPK
ncbi:MAG: 50S ribosomal protein L17 [Candidatus Omnitrophica bacterium]|nr:50S ribosomal protein L17 [Candidatus Omnitrophota bacterium]MBD3268783.1 50S ribosomal protein L17 [Candidatus Omnitrophota bacterium]